MEGGAALASSANVGLRRRRNATGGGGDGDGDDTGHHSSSSAAAAAYNVDDDGTSGRGPHHWTHEAIHPILGGGSGASAAAGRDGDGDDDDNDDVDAATCKPDVPSGVSGGESAATSGRSSGAGETTDAGRSQKGSSNNDAAASRRLSSSDIAAVFDASTNYSHSSSSSSASSSASRDRTTNLGLVDYTFRLFSALSVLVWIILVGIIYTVVPSDELRYMEGMERTAPVVAFAVLTVSALGWIVPPLLRQGVRRTMSGIMVGGLTVQVVALLTELMLFTLPVPVRTDPVTGVRVHLLRWCEWTPLAFLMTYLTEATDVPRESAVDWRAVRAPLVSGLCQGLSTLCGLIFPFCRGYVDWTLCMVLSFALFVVIYFRLAYKVRRFRGMEKGTTVDDIETYERGRLSLGLLWSCATMWSVMVASYFMYSFAPMFVPEGSLLKHGALTMASESFLDVLSKYVYMQIIVKTHDSVFDDAARTERRLKELREVMSVVWDSSSDVIVASVRGTRGIVTTMISPAYTTIFKKNARVSDDGRNGNTGLVLEFDPRDCHGQHFGRNVIPSSLQVHDLEFARLPSIKSKAASTVLSTEALSSLTELIFRAWDLSAKKVPSNKADSSSIGSRSKRRGSDGSLGGDDTVVISQKLDAADVAGRWEAKTTRLHDSALVMVLRDTSERSRRFEAEKKYVVESTKREKDAEANRFTRHEVKNGLLSAIGLCDSFADCLQKVLELQKGVEAGKKTPLGVDQDERSQIVDAPDDAPVIDPSTSVCLHELDRTLNEVLHMVLADAMSREIVHDVYELTMEYADVVKALSSHYHLRDFKAAEVRFPIIARPSPLPRIRCDLQLLTHIHRSAISNACKFGKKGGQVLTELHWTPNEVGGDEAGVLELRVLNHPGPQHDKFLDLGPVAEELVFGKGRTLQNLLEERGAERSDTCGNGCWIVQKCAHALGGICYIRFTPENTTFTFRFPSKAMKEKAAEPAETLKTKEEKFRIPENTWGIAIDDSKIQRKLMDRFLQYAGVRKDRVIVLGKNTEEIEGFVGFVTDFLCQHPNDHIFVIADENLDVVLDDAHHTTVSGSLCIESIRKRLLPGQEMRLLALVRSANDSSNDVAVYNARTHGYLPKAPLQRDKIPDMVAPLWEKRYPRSMAKQFFSSRNDAVDSEDAGFESDAVTSPSDLMQSIRTIDGIVSDLTEEDLIMRWSMIWEKLHALKGDMLTFGAGEDIRQVVYQINSLGGPSLPTDFVERWTKIRTLAEAAIGIEAGDEARSLY